MPATAINEISRYVRMAESSASNLTSNSDAVAVAQPQELVFYADIDGNGLAEKSDTTFPASPADGRPRPRHLHEPAHLRYVVHQ